ncbi:hypothetical protein [Polluticoccus soli]|uniref:hypothetical protein n=1 Tax=Polluticoccus soli TaxID=3034150 RepID=UPI0023E1CDA9|nr:hypothetical protein [Flavipsychrobacter sp. JY13-12]
MGNYEEYMLLEADGELTEAEQKALQAFMDQHPELKNEMELFSALKLEPDTSIVYEGKEDLMKTLPGPGKRTISLGSWWTYGAIAACLSLAILLFRKPSNDDPVNTIAHTTEPTKIDTKTTTGEELHSTPNSPVAIENKQLQRSKIIARIKKKNTVTIQNDIVEPAQVIEKGNIAVAPQKQEPTTQVDPIPEKKIEEYVQVPEIENSNLSAPKIENKQKQSLIAFAPVQEKFEGFSDIRQAVNEKVEKVKNITSRIKDTDIQFRFGNKELTVRL